ncbi:Uncharacterized protein APZ42_003919 [Daphnia magna]|uniref:Uncharacterized protein n=1 Tax=Daphnia magna TaxID=35525 RepID=A0A164HCY5_9CRUS|nr:Uncharacterized protein APZ42_003919 [Daphnia magna]
MAKRKRSSNPRAGTSHDDEYMPMMDDVMLSSTPFKTYGTDSSTAQDSHEESEDVKAISTVVDLRASPIMLKQEVRRREVPFGNFLIPVEKENN